MHCTLHTAHCTLHTAHCTLHTAHCTLHTAHFLTHVMLLHCGQFDRFILLIAYVKLNEYIYVYEGMCNCNYLVVST